MQQRRARNKTSDLPMTTADATRLENKRSQQYTNSKSKKSRGSSPSSPYILMFLFILIILGIVFFIKSAPDIVSSKQSNHISGIGDVSKPLSSKFPSLNYALTNSDIILLYFAASWCPESTSVSKKLEHLFSSPNSSLADKVLLPPNEAGSDPTKNTLSIVYISSDTSEDEMEGYIRSNWLSIPFDSLEKNDIKKHFRTCAKIEMQDLQIDPRRFEIPTILVIDSVTEAIISYTGVQEINQYNDEVLDHWLGIRDLMRGLESKYSEE
jgi:hypothetical protein